MKNWSNKNKLVFGVGAILTAAAAAKFLLIDNRETDCDCCDCGGGIIEDISDTTEEIGNEISVD